jgi:DNA-binding transcriptional regulator YhcF (GntR family)
MRSDWILTNERIKKAYKDIIETEKRMPTQQEVADKCDISVKTIERHLKKINLQDLVQPFRLFGNEVLAGLMKKASKGDAQAAKLFFMLIYDWSEKTEQKLTGDIRIEFKPAEYEDDNDGGKDDEDD